MYRFIVFMSLVTIEIISSLVGADLITIYDPTNYPFYTMPNACYGGSYCFEKGDDYPQAEIDKLLENVPEAFEKLLNNRQSDLVPDEYDANCPADTTYKDKPVYYVTDKLGVIRAVVQSDEKFLQTYSAKKCVREGRITVDTPDLNRTTFMQGHIINRYNISCVTQYLDFDFFVLNEQYVNPRMEVVTTALPVACRCQMSDLNE